jgi:erythronate-4-phosphate dehydrogenase
VSLRIVADRNIMAVEQAFADLGEVIPVDGRQLSPAQLVKADVLLVRSVTRVDEALLSGTAVRFVGTATSGYEHIDRDYLCRQGLHFAFAPGSNANSVVEYVLAAIAGCRDLLEELLAADGAAVGIIGYGVIGQALGARLSALGIAHRAYDPWLSQRQFPALYALDEVLSCRVISLHAALSDRAPWPSRQLLAAKELMRLAAPQLLINAGRGELIDGAALLARLQEPNPPTAVLDVWEREPRPDPALLSACWLGTAHIAGYSVDGKWRGTQALRRALLAWLGRSDTARMPAPGRDSACWPLPDADTAVTLRYLIQRSYDIGRDDAALRQAVGQPDDSGAAFDALRRQYSPRWELLGRQVSGGSSAARLCAVALGCDVI